MTVRVNAAVTPGMSDEDAFKARRAVMAQIEKESLDKTGFESQVVTLYQGGQYRLYRYKKYTDVRLVFAPEEQTAFYGGDPDNFEYPRFDLDICIFRAYENGQPAKVQNYLKWSAAGPSENELVFVSGNPGHTDRLRTVAELEYLRDTAYPHILERLNRLEVLLGAYSARSQENARRARNDLFGVRNSRKARDGALAGLLTPSLFDQLRTAERNLRAAVATNSALSDTQGAWDRVDQAQQAIAKQSLEFNMLERGYGFSSTLFGYGRELLRAAEERPKLDGDRLAEYRESARASFEFRLFAEQPIYADLETLKLADSLTYLAESLGYNNPLVQKILGGQSPHERALEAVTGSKLAS
ncbi:MAG: S46 family peptidase, partial [Limisphaerales bacterium]